jgi:hypothetical protein
MNEVNEKIAKIKNETAIINAESQRGLMVVNEKVAGWIIENIQSQRAILKDKNKAYALLGLLLRLNDLRSSVQMEYVQNLKKDESGGFSLQLSDAHKEKIKPLLTLTLDFYEKLRIELVYRFEVKDKFVRDFPKIETAISDSEKLLIELNICLGQMQGFVLGKLAMMFSS